MLACDWYMYIYERYVVGMNMVFQRYVYFILVEMVCEWYVVLKWYVKAKVVC